jgi:putative ABC transport system ATP-binding protein
MLTLENIEVSLGSHTKVAQKVLNKLNLYVREGEFIVVIGGNGAGKSTLFNIISGFIKPTAGKISISGNNVNNIPQTYRTKFVSNVMQDPKNGTIENMSIFENMSFALKRGQNRVFQLLSSKSRVKLFKEKLTMLNMGMENRLNELVCNLSGGQRQALSLIMATLIDSKILLLDEITASLDPVSTDYIVELTNKIVRKQNCACIMITHDMAHAIKYGDRLLILKGGAFIKEYDATTKSQLTAQELANELQRL